jgi:hypothetical protein
LEFLSLAVGASKKVFVLAWLRLKKVYAQAVTSKQLSGVRRGQETQIIQLMTG